MTIGSWINIILSKATKFFYGLRIKLLGYTFPCTISIIGFHIPKVVRHTKDGNFGRLCIFHRVGYKATEERCKILSITLHWP